MPTPFNIQLTRKSDGGIELCSGAFADADWQLLCRFRDFAIELRSAAWVRAGLDANYTVGPDAAGKFAVTVPNRPPDASVRELLHLMRPFVLHKEATSYTTINKLLARYLDHQVLRSELANARHAFNHGTGRRLYEMTIGDMVVNDAETFALWLNAFEYHRDQDKRAKLTAALGGTLDEFALAEFRSILADRAALVLHLATFISNVESAPSAKPGAGVLQDARGTDEADAQRSGRVGLADP